MMTWITLASGEQGWVSVVSEFYGPFAIDLARAEQLMPEVKTGPEPIGVLVRMRSRTGHSLGALRKFISQQFPDCRHTEAWLEKIGVSCPKDGGDIVA
jgi:DNA topoisomerase-1